MFGKKESTIDLCPLLKEPCIKARCAWWTHLIGENPQTHLPVDEYKCAVTWLPVMLVEVAQKTNQTGAAIESSRNSTLEKLDVLVQREANTWAAVEAFRNEFVAVARRVLRLPPPALPDSKLVGDN